MATVPGEAQGPSDAELIDAVRKGTLDAYGSLYERHSAAAYNLARQLARSPAEQDDLVAEAFEKVLATLRAGRGPDSAFRAYLLTALRHTAYDKTRRDRKLELTDDVGEASGVNPEAVSVPFTDTAVAGLERSMAARAFASLPERWQTVLWHTEIERQSPAEIAPILGLTPNGVSALAYRAREGLKQAYLQEHLAETSARRCRATADRLGAWTRHGLSKRETAQVEAHLDECDHCRALAAELADVNGALRVVIAPLVLGSAAAGYLAAASVATKSVITGGVALGTAGGAAGAGASLPRQVVGVTASGAALAAAIVIGLASGGGQQIPQAESAPAPTPTATPTAAPPTPAPPSPSPSPPAPSPPAPSPAQPPPAGPNLTASSAASSVSLIAGGDAVDLPITVRNTGGTVSGPVQATLALPPGVSAIASGPVRFAGAPLLRFNAAQPAGTVFCPGGTGTVTCGTGTGLPPGGTVILLFRVVAAADSPGGEITGSVSDGGTIRVRVAVRVVVTPPAAVDGVDVLATAERFDILLPGLFGKRIVNVTATNTGTSTKPVSVTIDRPGARLFASVPMSCTVLDHATTCVTGSPVPPRGVIMLRLKLTGGGLLDLHCPHGPVTVAAALGTANDSTTVKTECWSLLPGLLPDTEPQQPQQQQQPQPPRPPRAPVEPPAAPPAGPAPLITPGTPGPPATPAAPPSPLPSVQQPPPPAGQGKSILPPLLGWLLPR